ncbi:glycosyltransferase family 2 protein [Salegentibacter sp. LM13S]|uniref:glycosyltransferase family 2 protein n=1 Tax=Salegentibacter lacus TaxID=2873599 RepID=UPI001CCC784E|nr:glycosyltransferase family 2 protein [Salegentibacter lacus]MBZ9631481.1 glycosyltransferase family 2 protein [Salegentibacter lacus]
MQDLIRQRKRVGVVVLTFNRISLLKIGLCKILNQSALPVEILVVDNASWDGTSDYLSANKNITNLRLEENSGPAGGFYYGIKYFAEKKNVDYLWLMDDDFFPKNDCLEELLKVATPHALYFPYIREKDFKSKKDPGWWGVLLPIEIVDKVKYPNKDLFFWGEDTEYLKHRINEVYKFSSQWVASAKGVHFTKRDKNSRPPWRYYYEARNNIYVRVFIRKTSLSMPVRIYKAFKAWSFLLGGILLYENNKSEKMKFFLLGTFHGIFKKLGKVIDPGKDVK